MHRAIGLLIFDQYLQRKGCKDYCCVRCQNWYMEYYFYFKKEYTELHTYICMETYVNIYELVKLDKEVYVT